MRKSIIAPVIACALIITVGYSFAARPDPQYIAFTKNMNKISFHAQLKGHFPELFSADVINTAINIYKSEYLPHFDLELREPKKPGTSERKRMTIAGYTQQNDHKLNVSIILKKVDPQKFSSNNKDEIAYIIFLRARKHNQEIGRAEYWSRTTEPELYVAKNTKESLNESIHTAISDQLESNLKHLLCSKSKEENYCNK